MRTFTYFVLSLFAAATAQAAQPQETDANDGLSDIGGIGGGPAVSVGTPDPWEGFNRKMFAMNNALDKAILVPAAKAYRATTHKKQRKGIRNLLANAKAPLTFVNDILQGEFKRAGETLGRFAVNTTIGFGGMGDPAARMGIQPHTEDFGQTLAVWGTPSGPYLYLPLLGPSSVRDGFGRATEMTVAEPLFWLKTDAANYTGYAQTSTTFISLREPLIEPLQDIEDNSLDYYASFRSFYLQNRKREIANGRTDFDDLPDIGSFDDFDDFDDELDDIDDAASDDETSQ